MTYRMQAPALSTAQVAAWLGVVAIGTWVSVLSWTGTRVAYDTWVLILLLPLLFLVGVGVLRVWTRRASDEWVFQLAVLALAVKLASSILRYLMAWVLYSGSDAIYYHEFGLMAAQEYRVLDFSRDLPFGGIPGTGFVAAVTATVYGVTNPSLTAGYAVFAFLGFWGQWMAYRGFRNAVPDGNHRRYAVLVLFLPTLVFWPSALGKDAWMQLGIGMALLGAGLLTRRRWSGWLLLGLGVLATGLVRPHVAGIVGVALAGGMLLRRPARRTSLTPLLRTAAVVVLASAGAWAAWQGARYVGAESLSVKQLQGAMEGAGGRTEQGGSEFSPVPLVSPLGVPAAFLTVLFRPLPFDAHNAQSMLAALEGSVLLWLTWCWRSSMMASLRRLRDSPYLATCVIATVLFVVAFSGFANFGIVVRQRAQVLPLFLALLCVPPRTLLSTGTYRPLAATASRPGGSR